MPCFIGCLAILFPRIVLAVLFFFTSYLHQAYHTVLWPVLGFVFLPLTTLAYAFAINQHGKLDGWYLLLFVVAVLVDLGLIGGGGAGARGKKKWQRTAL